MLNDLLKRYPALAFCADDIENAKNLIIDCYKDNGKLLLCGNGGSCADCEHIVGELMKGFLKKRPLSAEKRNEMKNNYKCIEDATLDKLQCGLPAISLSSITALNTAFCNDVDAELVYAQALLSLANANDVLFAISTSGNSKNIINTAKIASCLGLKVIALTGKTGGKLKDIADICICVPEIETFKVQELHLPVYHYLCAAVEKHYFDK